MEMTLRPMTEVERMYSYTQDHQIMMQTGCIGHLRGDFGRDGDEFFSTWDDHRTDIKSDAFKAEFDDVINALRSDKRYGGILKNRTALAAYCRKQRDSDFHNDRQEHGFRVDSEHYAYMLRLTPIKGDYNIYCYCYLRQWLGRHMAHAEKGIRFINSGYGDLFRLPDGERIKVTYPDGKTESSVCRYVDETHMVYKSSLYHICEFAELAEGKGWVVEPEKPILPERCLSMLPSTGEIISIVRGESGFYPTDIHFPEKQDRRIYVNRVNKNAGVTKAQEAAMLAGSMFGWDTRAANPCSYDKYGQPLKPKAKNRDDAR